MESLWQSAPYLMEMPQPEQMGMRAPVPTGPMLFASPAWPILIVRGPANHHKYLFYQIVTDGSPMFKIGEIWANSFSIT